MPAGRQPIRLQNAISVVDQLPALTFFLSLEQWDKVATGGLELWPAPGNKCSNQISLTLPISQKASSTCSLFCICLSLIFILTVMMTDVWRPLFAILIYLLKYSCMFQFSTVRYGFKIFPTPAVFSMLITAFKFQVLRTQGVAHHLLAMCPNASRGSLAKVHTPALTVRESSSPRPAISVWVTDLTSLRKIYL